MIGSLALATLRTRKAAFAGAYLALLCAAALLTACGVLMETGLRGAIPAERYAGTPIVVAADQNAHWTRNKKDDTTKVKSKPLTERAWLPEGLTARLEPLPGVAALVPEVAFPADVLDRTPRPSGVPSRGYGWSSAALTPYTLRAGRPPAAPGEIVLDVLSGAGAKVGDQVTVQTTAPAALHRVVGLAAPRGGGPRHQAAVFFSDAEARRLAGRPGQITALGVLPEPGADTAALARAVRAALDGTPAKVHTGEERGPLEFRDAAQARTMLISMGGALGGTALAVAILVVVGTLALSIQQRRRELAVLRAVAATPRQIRAMIGREALAVGLLATPPGAAAGLALAAWLRGRFVDLGAMPEVLRPSFSPFPVLGSVAATLAAAWIAARISGRRTARPRPTEALQDAAVPSARPGPARALAGLAVLAAHVVLLAVLARLDTEAAASPVTFLSVVLAAVATALLGPPITHAAATILGVPLRASRAAGFLAAANTRAAARRLASVTTPLTLAVAMTGTILFVQTTLGHAAGRQADQGTLAPYALAGPAGVPAGVADAARRLEGVGEVTQIVRTTLRVGVDKYPAQGVTPGRPSAALDLDVREGSLDRLAPGALALSATAADHRGARLGDRIPLILGDGTRATARLVAIYRRGLGFGDVTLPFEQVAGHVDDPRADTVLITPRPGAAPVARRGLAALAAAGPGPRLLEAGAPADRRRAARQGAAQVNLAAMGLIIAFTAIALVNSLAMATGDRARELALLRLAGATRRQIMRMLRWETLILVATGAAAGTAIAAATLTAFAAGMTRGAPPHAPPLACLGILAAVTALALAARLALREHPAEVIGSRE
ncbi:FtsX-like permease family protein [Actinomadura rugatobispora]|uniref:FtsX-like permease family protein n=1 Tax=Actinomadura rugatobispora TaxID=1994 RepID=A0ABW1A9H1_9ACTN